MAVISDNLNDYNYNYIYIAVNNLKKLVLNKTSVKDKKYLQQIVSCSVHKNLFRFAEMILGKLAHVLVAVVSLFIRSKSNYLKLFVSTLGMRKTNKKRMRD